MIDNDNKSMKASDRRDLIIYEGQESGPLIRMFTKFSAISLINRLNLKRLMGWRKVVEEETRLNESLVSHGRSRGRLENIDKIIKKDNIEIDTEYEQAKLNRDRVKIEREFINDEREVTRLRFKAHKAELKATIKKYEGTKNEDSSVEKLKEELKIKSAQWRLHRQHDLDKLINDLRFTMLKRKTLERVFNEVCDEIFPGKTPENLSEEERSQFDYLNDIYEMFLDKT